MKHFALMSVWNYTADMRPDKIVEQAISVFG